MTQQRLPRGQDTLWDGGLPAGVADGRVDLALFGLYEQVSVRASIAAIPVPAWEVSLAVWLIVKGFGPSAVASLDARQRPGTGGAPALAAVAG